MLQNITPVKLYSEQDSSVNFVWTIDNERKVEARFVQRTRNYFIVYLSSQTGCNQSCRFCHLTGSKQTTFDQVELNDFLIQVRTVFDYYQSLTSSGNQPADYVHFNWMARGEPLLNPTVVGNRVLYDQLAKLATNNNLDYKFNISSIVPTTGSFDQFVETTKSVRNLRLYVSMYSIDSDFRKRWLPKAHEPETIARLIKQLHRANQSIGVKLHWALIEGANDRPQDLQDITNWLVEQEMQFVSINFVRYNPFAEKHGVESKEYDAFASHLQSHVKSVQIIPKVGFDVKASCGMFV